MTQKSTQQNLQVLKNAEKQVREDGRERVLQSKLIFIDNTKHQKWNLRLRMHATQYVSSILFK